jgi:hypothetical protein
MPGVLTSQWFRPAWRLGQRVEQHGGGQADRPAVIGQRLEERDDTVDEERTLLDGLAHGRVRAADSQDAAGRE